MRRLLLFQSTLLLLFVIPSALASEREPQERNIYLSEHPQIEAPSVHVIGRIATLLRFEQPCEPAGTKMLGWEGRFEPVACVGRSVLLWPLKDLAPGDRLMLLVTLADGTEVPFTVSTWHGETLGSRRGDQQVNVFRDRQSHEAVLASLYASLGRERELEAKVERYEQEDSVDHALAALLAKGEAPLTPFRPGRSWVLEDEEVAIKVQTYSGKSKAAVVFEVTNEAPTMLWRLREARLMHPVTGRSKAFVLREQPRDGIVPGATGAIAVIVDGSAFESPSGVRNLALELFRHDGLRQVYISLDHRLVRR